MKKLLAYKNGDRYGYIDVNGNVVLPFTWKFASFFSEGLAFVRDENNKLAFIDENGSIVISCEQWDVVQDFHEGLALVRDVSQKWGFIDKAGNNVIPCQWKFAYDFSEDYAAVQNENDLWGYINRQGEIVIPCKYKEVHSFQNGFATVQLSEDNWTFIDKGGNLFYSNWTEVRDFAEGLAPVKNSNGRWGYINEKGEVKLDFQWSDAHSFSEGLASVSVNEKFGFINLHGELVITCQWTNAGSFNEGLAPVAIEFMKWGYINTDGEMVIPARWTVAPSIKDGKAFVFDVFTMESGYIDKAGRFFNPSHPLINEKLTQQSIPFNTTENMTTNGYKRADSENFAQKVSRKIKGWYSNKTYHDKAVKRIVLQREEIYSLFDKVEKVSVVKLMKFLDSSGFFYRPSSAYKHHNFPGGLAEHSLGVFRIVEGWNNMTPDERRNSDLYKFNLKDKQLTCDIFREKMNYDDMVIASICHDLCKAKHYYMDGRLVKSHKSDPEYYHKHGLLSKERLVKNGITDKKCHEILLAVLMHMRLFSKARSKKEAENQREGKSSLLTIVVWAADKLDASRHPAGGKHKQL